MKLSRIGRVSMALAASVALGLGMTACGGGTIGFMWVTGTQSTATTASSIVGFKIDNFTGNLTNIPRSPFNSVGVNPGTLVVRAGGRYVYVVNKGTTVQDPNDPTKTVSNGDGNISAFSVGGDGVLTFQESYSSQGGTPVWATTDTSGGFLYVLDSLAPAGSTYNAAGLGDVTVFSIAADTGRLALVTNQQVKDPVTNINLNYFPVGPNPTMMRVQSAGCLFILDKNQAADAHNTYVFPYQIQSGGQLVTTVTGNITTGATNLSSLTPGGGAYLYLTDLGPNDSAGASTTSGFVFAYSVGATCALNAVVGSPFANVSPAQNPVWTVTEARNSKFVYVLNQSNSSSTQANSSISAFSIDATGRLTAVPGTNNPYSVGSGPTCMVEDPTNKYLYTSNSVDGTVTGKAINLSTGELSALQRGSTFSAVTHASCLVVSGAVS